MSTTIDSLAIEIQSNSSGAVGEIERLAKALESIKKSTVTKTAVNNLKSLTTALKELTPVSSNANKLGALAESIKKISSAGSLRGITSQLKELPSALRGLSDINIDGVAPKLESVAGALGPLANIKGKGFNDAMSGLSKLGEATKKLDSDTINGFVAKVKELDEKLGPVSTKLIAVGNAIKNVNITSKSASSNVGNFGDKVNSTALNMSSLATVAQSLIATLRPLITLISNSISSAIEWDGIEYQFGNSFGEQADEYYKKITKITEALKLNKQMFMENSAMATSMLKGFGVRSEDAREMGLGYTELAYDIWAAFNNVYKSFDGADGAMAAVRSAIAGEVEPIRRAGFTIVDSQLKITAANYGIAYSSDKATEAQKSYLRYLTLVDQAHTKGIVGAYAHEMNTAEGQMRAFSQQLKSLSQTFGSVFMPVLTKVMPWLQAFVELLGEAIRSVASFFGVEIQKVDFGSGFKDLESGANGANEEIEKTEQSLKDLKNATIGIDELNVISPQKDSGASGDMSAYEALDIESLWDESIFNNIQEEVEKIKESIKGWIPVVETVGIALGLLGAAKLISDLTNALEKMDLLSKAIFGVGTALIEASLVFVFADNYLEEGNLLNLIGQGISTALGSYLLYKTWGTTGLAIGVAVSVAAQLVAITLNLADGGVKIDDPELWIQSAFTTLTGAAGGALVFWKAFGKLDAGKGAIFGALASLSLTLAAITIGGVAEGGLGLTEAITGILSTVAGGAAGAALVSFLGIATGGTGFLIGAAAMLAVNVIGAIVGSVAKDAEKNLQEDLTSRFGKIELDNKTMEFYVSEITAIPRKVTIDARVFDEKLQEYKVQETTVSVDVALDLYKSESETLQTIENQITAIEKDLDANNIKIALGMTVDYEDYSAEIESYITLAQEYLDQYYLTANIALGITDADSDGSLATTLDTFYTQNTAKLTELGENLKSAISDAFVDGEWIPDKLEEARQIQEEIQEVLSYVSDVEYRAKLQDLTIQVTGDSLTPESFDGVLSEAQAAIEDKLAALEEVKMSQLKVAIMEYDANIASGVSEAEAKKIYDQTVEDIEVAYQNGKLEVQYGTVDFGLSTLQNAFADELKRVKAEGLLDFDNSLEYTLELRPGIKWDNEGADVYGNMLLLTGDIAYSMEEASKTLTAEARENLEALLEEMTPQMEDFEKVASECRKLGQEVPESIRTGLNDYNELKALAGDVDGINYMIGQGFSTDPTFLNTLATAEGAGADIDESIADGLLNNLQVVQNAADDTISFLSNGIEVGVFDATPTLVQNMEDLGVDITDGLGTGMEDSKPGLFERLKTWWNEFWGFNRGPDGVDAHSPSKKAISLMEDVTDGLVKGLSLTALTDRFSEMWKNVTNWWDNKDNLKTYTPSIGSIRDKVSSAWTDAKNWWDNYKGNMSFTPAIGSIRDALSSAWATAKTWWNENVRLSIPSLSLSVTYTEATGLKKAIVSALGLQGWPKLSFAASGGIFDMGSLVWAGESGPEIVANAGSGKTGVMNVQQMSDAVYEGVYSAVVAAMRASGNGENTQAVNVYLDGKQITATVEKRQRERGATLMTGGMAYGY